MICISAFSAAKHYCKHPALWHKCLCAKYIWTWLNLCTI